MTFTEVSSSINAGKYNCELPYPSLISKNHIFDPEKSAGWNRDEVEAHNKENREKQKLYFEKRKSLVAMFKADLIQAIEDCFSLNTAQAELIFMMAWDRGHGCGLYQVIPEAEKLAEFYCDMAGLERGNQA